jgi:hypothetical protein
MPMNSPKHPISHQTVRLAPGRHARPEEGACVMELASMLAGERFTDHPRAVSGVIAWFLRAYNDGIDAERRRDLYPYAAMVVGSRASRRTERARLERCDRELAELGGRPAGRWRRIATPVLRVIRPSPYDAALVDELAGVLCATESGHRRALRLVADLVDVRPVHRPPCRAMSGRPEPPARRRGSGAPQFTLPS